MAEDNARAAAAKSGQPSDKRKKRKPKRKKATVKYPTLAILPAIQTEPVDIVESLQNHTETQVPLSPRKQTLMRHKNSDASIGEPLFVSEVKELKKNRKSVPLTTSAGSEYGKFSINLSNQNIEDKVSLFKCSAARIVVFHEQLVDSGSSSSSGTLLGHGEFEIFQLHNGDVTYLSCGPSFVYPLLPKLKMLRVDKNHFILPLLNPQRYWKIHIDSHETCTLGQLELVLKKIVKYTDLSLPEQQNDPEQTVLETEPATNHKSSQFTPYFQDIPELPPSAPASPSNLHLFVRDTFLFLPVKKPDFTVQRKKSNQSINSALASFNLADPARKEKVNGAIKHALVHPRPVVHANPYRKNASAFSDQNSDLSSMDSLIDEYEENISTTKSINFNISRPQSRAVSITSTSHPTPVQYLRGKVALFPDRMSHLGSQYGTVDEDDEEEDDFPTTSLSQYNRTRQNSRSVRSRRSSPSELYTSLSNWMEPGATKNKLAHSRSTYSLASKPSVSRLPTLNDTYREIYRSFTLHNLSLISSGKEKRDDSQKSNVKVPIKTTSHRAAASPYYSKLLVSEQLNRKTSEREPRKHKLDGLSSNEVYRLLSSRDQRAEKLSGLGRFFGW